MVQLVLMGMVALAAASASECEESQDETAFLQSHAASKQESADSPWCLSLGCSDVKRWCVEKKECCQKLAVCRIAPPMCSNTDSKAEHYIPPLPANAGCGETYPGSDCVSATASSYYSSGPSQLSRITNAEQKDGVLKDLYHSHLKDHLFGDKGYKSAGWGGLFNYETVSVDAPNVNLYGLRSDNFADIWFVDEATWNGVGSFENFTNNVAMVCWEYTWAIKCELKQGAETVVGSGNWRNTSFKNFVNSSSCPDNCQYKKDEELPGGGKLKEIQTADPALLQYVMNPGKTDENGNLTNVLNCYINPINVTNLTESFAHSTGTKLNKSQLIQYLVEFEQFEFRLS